MNKQEIEKAIEYMKFSMELQLTATRAMIHANGRKKLGKTYLKEMGQRIVNYKTVISSLTQQLNNGWIPVSERWPDKSGHYLVTYHEWTDGNYLPKYDEVYVKILRYHEAIFRLPVCVDEEAEKDMHREIIAWQSLPEPYKEDKDAERN